MQISATPPTFAEYQLIHQTQERQRNPAPQQVRQVYTPVTSDPWPKLLHRSLQSALLLAAGFVGALFLPGELKGKIRFFGVIVVIGLLGTAFSLLHQRWEYWRAFKQQRARPQPESLEFSEAGLRLHYPLGTVFHPWDSLCRIREMGDWLLLYPDMEFCYYLNLQRLPEPLTAADVRALIQWSDMRTGKAIFAV